MGGTHEPIKKRPSYLQTVTVDVDIDASVLEDNGYHHEEDCSYEPCRLLSDDFRSTP